MKITLYNLFGIMLLLASCHTIEDRDGVGPLATKNQLKITAVNTTTVNGKKGNQIAVNNATPLIAGQWNLLVKVSNKQQDTAVLPFKGLLKIPFIGTSAGGLVYDTITIQVDTIDHAVDPTYKLLAGSGEKTWVWASGNKFQGGDVIYGRCGASDYTGTWQTINTTQALSFSNWDGDGPESIDINGTMTFDLNGAANFTKTEFGVTTKGAFVFDFSTHKSAKAIGQITFGGTTILHGVSDGDHMKVVNTFDIISLTDDEMVLLYPTDRKPNSDWGEAAFWIFKRQGYIYP